MKHSRSFDWQSSPDDERYDANVINIPVISTHNPAQTPYALRKLNEVLEDRQNIRGRISGFLDTLSRIGTQKDTEALQKRIETSNSALKDSVEQQIRCAEALEKAIETSNSILNDAFQELIDYAEGSSEQTPGQNAASSVTALNVLFLPLGFFAQV